MRPVGMLQSRIHSLIFLWRSPARLGRLDTHKSHENLTPTRTCLAFSKSFERISNYLLEKRAAAFLSLLDANLPTLLEIMELQFPSCCCADGWKT